jgi:hypothetical protein
VKTIETVITVLVDGSIHVPPHPGLPPGDHRAVLVVDDRATKPTRSQEALDLKMLDWSAWPIDAAYRREELYDDDGR